METSLAESQTDSLSHKVAKWLSKSKDVSDTHIQRRTITKINQDRRTALERSVKSISLGGGGAGGEVFHWGRGGLNRFYVATKKRQVKSPGSATITNRSPSQTPRGRGNR